MSEDAFAALSVELDCWRRAGRVPTLWWRDDDAAAAHGSLERLLALSARHRVPVALAVIPARMDASLPPLLGGTPDVRVLQHGFAHVDHAARDEPGAELGEHRPAGVVLAELARGLQALSTCFGERFAPVLVPPWNRIAPRLVPELAGLGFRGLSCFAPRASAAAAAGLVLCNCHVDPVNWRRGGVFRGSGKCVAALTGHLSARRLAMVDPAEPSGLLTHHLRHDEPLWAFLDELFERLAHAAPVRWLGAGEVFRG